MYFVVLHKKKLIVLEVLDNILYLLKKNKKKQKELSDFLGLSPNIFTEWKSGRNTSYLKYLPNIAEFFGISVDSLLGNAPSTHSEQTSAMYENLIRGLSTSQIKQLEQFADFLRNIRTAE